MHDLCVIGGGIGGYSAALKAAGLGKKVLIIEKDQLGGECLNHGCIPTKIYAYTASLLEKIHKLDTFGISVENPSLNFLEVLNRKNSIVEKLRTSLDTFLKSKQIDIMSENAGINADGSVEVGGRCVFPKNIIIATGSQPSALKDTEFDSDIVISYKDLLKLEKLPTNLAIVGGGVIGCEFASIFASFGVKVAIIEQQDRLIPIEDKELASRLKRALVKKNIDIYTGTSVENIQKNPPQNTITLSSGKSLQADKILVCIGRKANAQNHKFEEAGIETINGWIVTDAYFKTSKDNIYAVGDCTGKYFLAHMAAHCAEIAAENIFLKPKRTASPIVPRTIFTSPQIAAVGLTQEQASEEEFEIDVVKIPFQMLGISHVTGSADGIFKLIIERESKRILGAHIIADEIVDLITPLTLAIEKRVSIDGLKDLICAHPTKSEIISEAIHSMSLKTFIDKDRPKTDVEFD